MRFFSVSCPTKTALITTSVTLTKLLRLTFAVLYFGRPLFVVKYYIGQQHSGTHTIRRSSGKEIGTGNGCSRAPLMHIIFCLAAYSSGVPVDLVTYHSEFIALVMIGSYISIAVKTLTGLFACFVIHITRAACSCCGSERGANCIHRLHTNRQWYTLMSFRKLSFLRESDFTRTAAETLEQMLVWYS